MRAPLFASTLLLAACASKPPVSKAAASSATPPARTATAAAAAAVPVLSTHSIALPGANGAVSLDYLAVDRKAGRVWIPAGNTGGVDVLDVASEKISAVPGFPTVEREMRGKKRVLGPSSATIGDGVVYAGNRASSEVCAIDPEKLGKLACIELVYSPDGLQYVAATKTVWVTTPRDQSLVVLDASVPAKLAKGWKIKLPGEPEGYAIDEGRGVFYTNLEDKDQTLAIDVKTRQVIATWPSRCGAEGPRGLALDAERQQLFVACTDAVEVLDAAHGGALLSRLETGAGVDNIDFVEGLRRLYIAAGKAARLTVAEVDASGGLHTIATAPTAEGARVVVADRTGTAFVADPMKGSIIIAPAAAH